MDIQTKTDIIHQKIYDFLLYIYPLLAKYPKFEKFSLQTATRNAILEMLQEVIKWDKTATKSHLYTVDTALQESKELLRLAHDLKYSAMNAKHYGESCRKLKEIGVMLPFYDRVVQHAINNVLEPIFDKRFISQSYACRKGKGMHAASDTLKEWLYEWNKYHPDQPLYAIKADIHHYFQSIDHAILKAEIRKVIKDAGALALLDRIIDHNGNMPDGVGIPVGNLTSQLFANIYLDALDQFINCHPYSSWERGTNEVTNKMIRRKIPKGTNFDDKTEEEVENIENWINGYPRKIHGYRTAGELFEEEVKQLA